jgi:methyl-accepting chemotaxis protein WspA
MQMDKFGGDVREGVGRVAELNAQTGKIIEEVQALSDRFQAVNEGMRQQSVGADQINEAMGQLTAATRQTQTSLEELNQTAADLRGAVEGLNREISEFTV